MAKRLQQVRLVLADGTDLSNWCTEVRLTLRGDGATVASIDFVAPRIDVDPETRRITVTANPA